MNIQSLQYFVELARYQNFSEAAHHLHLSQPALSKSVSELERELGHTLVVRSRPLQLTLAGRRVLSAASAICNNYRRMLNSLASLKEDTTTEIRLQGEDVDPFLHPLMRTVAHEVSQAFPAASLTLVNDARRNGLAMLEDDEIDLAILWKCSEQDSFRLPLGSAFEQFSLTPPHCELTVFAARDSEVTRKESLSLSDLAALSVCRPVGVAYDGRYDAMENFFVEHGLDLQWIYLDGTALPDMLSQMAYDPNTVFLLPSYATASVFPSAYLQQLAKVPLAEPVYMSPIAVLRADDDRPVIRAIADALPRLVADASDAIGKE